MENLKNTHKRSLVKKIFIAIGCVLLIILVISGAVIAWQWDNVLAVVDSFRYSEQELETQISDSKEELLNTLKSEYNISEIRDLTPEEEEKIIMGEASYEEVMQSYLMETGQNSEAVNEIINDVNSNDNSADKSKKEESKKAASSSSSEASEEEIISRNVSKLYALKAYYLGQIGSVVNNMKAEYKALPKAQRNAASKEKIISKNISYALGLEGTCDGKVEAVLSNLKSELEKIGADTSIVGTLRSAYNKEKSLKKSYYMSAYK